MNLDELQSLYDFKDRTVLVTGGTGLLGLEIACALVECNANVVILSRNRVLAVKSVAEYIKQVRIHSRNGIPRKPEKCQKTRRVPQVGCTHCWAASMN